MRKALPEFLYHGTTSQCLDGILENGLVLNREILGIPIKPVLFFANSVSRARFYAFMRKHVSGFAPKRFRKGLFKDKGDPIILRVQTSNLDSDALRPDFRKLWGEWGQWRYYKDVPSDVIEIEEYPATGRDSFIIGFWAIIVITAIGIIISYL